MRSSLPILRTIKDESAPQKAAVKAATWPIVSAVVAGRNTIKTPR
jgi:hypothetical protein